MDTNPLCDMENYRNIKNALLVVGASVVNATSEYSGRLSFNDLPRISQFRAQTRRNLLKIHEDILAGTELSPHSLHTAEHLRTDFIQHLNAQINPENTYPDNIQKQLIDDGKQIQASQQKPSKGIKL